ncbi:hypothetical protein JHK82_054020 [Glycine max]|nr:hypothetical protein JHK85_054821 [Glycine max]KAG5083856.1 hypothetical protein JHK84_053894 [Glycine max]KAG5086623.1 hypothetical protein JHK82_054020 [Glycine max]
MDEESKRMEEGINSALNGGGNKDDLKRRVTIKTSNGGSVIEHDKGTMAKPYGAESESVQKIAEQEQPVVKQKTKRIATLDAFRGLTIVLMILVDDAGEAYPRIDHSPWNGCTLADFVMPFFLFIVGIAIALALKRIAKIKHAVKKIILRTLKLLFWGIILQGGYSHAPDDLEYGVNMKFIRWCGILQVICGMRGHLGPACNAVGHACTFSSPASGPFRDDAPSWCRSPFEPEGLLSSISAILSGTIGIHYGHILIHFKGHSERLKQWVLMGFVLLIIAIILHFTDALPINKQLYSFSYVCFTAGAAGIVFSGLYILIDVWGLRTPFLFLEWIGMNAMLVFVMAAEGIFAAFVNGWTPTVRTGLSTAAIGRRTEKTFKRDEIRGFLFYRNGINYDFTLELVCCCYYSPSSFVAGIDNGKVNLVIEFRIPFLCSGE